LSNPLAALTLRLGLSDDEALAIFRIDALTALGGEHRHRPEIEILDGLTAEAQELAGDGSVARWVRSNVDSPTPLELLQAGDWPGFEDALDRWLRDSGVIG